MTKPKLKGILYKGVFWIKDTEDINNNDAFYKIECDSNGNIKDIDSYDISIFGKSVNSFNHKKLWESLPNKVVDGKEYDYYPRGRVEISNGKATIFITQYLVEQQDKILNYIKDKYNLYKENGIKEINIFIDGSDHYKPKCII